MPTIRMAFVISDLQEHVLVSEAIVLKLHMSTHTQQHSINTLKAGLC